MSSIFFRKQEVNCISNIINNKMASLRIITYNVNGIRAAMKKGLVDWIKTNPADIICLQETKAEKDNVAHEEITSLGYLDYWFSAQKKGYSGVAVFTKIKPDQVQYSTGHAVSDEEGRVLQLDFGDIRLINAYFPSGTSGEIRQGNKNSSGFLPAERDCMDKLLDSGWTDSFRIQHPEPHRYSWWSQRFPSVRLNNKGWRIDYINLTNNLAGRILKSEIYPDIKQSDHCPVFLELKTK